MPNDTHSLEGHSDAVWIASPSNKTFKRFKSLSQRKYRESLRRFILEGERYVNTAMERAHSFEALVFKMDFWEALEQAGRERYRHAAPCYILDDALFAQLADTAHAQGVLGIARVPETVDPLGVLPLGNKQTLEHSAPAEDGGAHLLFLDGIQDPGNMGTIIRTADAAGIGGIYCAKGSVDPYNPKVVRSTAGSILNVPIFTLPSSDTEDMHVFFDRLWRSGYHVVVAALEGARDYRDADCYGPRTCLVIGNEASGVSEIARRCAHSIVKIPIRGGAESLNAAVAAGILLYTLPGESL